MKYIQVSDEMRNHVNYNGNSPKFGITIDGEDYIVKVPKDNDIYDTSVYSEYICSNLIRNCFNIYCQDVRLGRYQDKIVDVIMDFTSGANFELHSFRDTKQSSEDTDLGPKEYTYDDVLYLIEKHLKMTESEKRKVKIQFWNMFICDAVCANRDRHWGNWGYLSYQNTYITAPIYDNGSSLFPGVLRVLDVYENKDTRKTFLQERIFVFPASLFRIRRADRSYRSNYYEIFSDTSRYDLFEETAGIFIRGNDWRDIMAFMLEITEDLEIPASLKRFYVEIVILRYRCIVCRDDFEGAYIETEKELGDIDWRNG